MKFSLSICIEPKSFKRLVWLIVIVIGYYFGK